MNTAKTYAPLVARIFIAALFLIANFGKFGDIPGFTGYLTSGGLPAFLAWPSIIFEIALGLSMLVGFQVRIAAPLGAAFCIVAAVLYHLHPADQTEMTFFLKDLAIAGGFLMFWVHGAGAIAIDKD